MSTGQRQASKICLFAEIVNDFWPLPILAKRLILIALFSIRVFFRRNWRVTGQQGKGGDHLLLHPTTSTPSRKSKHLFATLYVRWLPDLCLPDCYSMRFTTLLNYHLTDWLMMQCLSTWWFNSRFITAIWRGKPVDLNSNRLSNLFYKRTDKPSVLVFILIWTLSKNIVREVYHFLISKRICLRLTQY